MNPGPNARHCARCNVEVTGRLCPRCGGVATTAARDMGALDAETVNLRKKKAPKVRKKSRMGFGGARAANARPAPPPAPVVDDLDYEDPEPPPTRVVDAVEPPPSSEFAPAAAPVRPAPKPAPAPKRAPTSKPAPAPGPAPAPKPAPPKLRAKAPAKPRPQRPARPVNSRRPKPAARPPAPDEMPTIPPPSADDAPPALPEEPEPDVLPPLPPEKPARATKRKKPRPASAPRPAPKAQGSARPRSKKAPAPPRPKRSKKAAPPPSVKLSGALARPAPAAPEPDANVTRLDFEFTLTGHRGEAPRVRIWVDANRDGQMDASTRAYIAFSPAVISGSSTSARTPGHRNRPAALVRHLYDRCGARTPMSFPSVRRYPAPRRLSYPGPRPGDWCRVWIRGAATSYPAPPDCCRDPQKLLAHSTTL